MAVQLKLGRHHFMCAAGCGLAFAGSLGALGMATGRSAVEASVSAGLPALREAWRPVETAAHRSGISGVAAVAFRGSALRHGPSSGRADNERVSGQVSGDEGFWLSTRALAGSDGTALAVGAPLTIAGHAYVISELHAVAPDGVGDGGAQPAHQLTLVVARETSSSNGQAPRVLRFLIDTAQVPPQGEPEAAKADEPHRTL